MVTACPATAARSTRARLRGRRTTAGVWLAVLLGPAVVALAGCGGNEDQANGAAVRTRALKPSSVVLVPLPRQVQWGSGAFTIGGATDLVAWSDATVVRKAMARLRGAVVACGLPAPPARIGSRLAKGAGHIVLRPPTPAELAAQPKLAEPEGYLLTVAPYRISLVAGTPRGLFCAAQTLAQMISGASVPACRIQDWPLEKVRALHFTVNPDAFADERIYPALIEAAARLKFNTVVVQFQSTIELRKHPEAVRSTGVVSQATVRRWVALARSYGMEIFPEIKSWGHADWTWGLGNVFYDHDTGPAFPLYSPMFCLPQGMDGQNTFTPGPKPLRLLSDTYAEMIDVFGGPKHLHVGGDEAWAWGYRQGVAAGDPVTDGIAWLRDLAGVLRSRGVTMICAGDMFLDHDRWFDSAGPGCNSRADLPTCRILRHLPTDIIINDWHYRVKADYPSLPYFQSQGFQVLASVYGFYGHDNITNFNRRVVASGALGVVQTTWRLLHTETGFIAYGAEAAWNGGEHTEAELGVDFEAFAHALLDPLLYTGWQSDCLDFRGGRPIYPPFTTAAARRSYGADDWGEQ